MTKAHLTKKNTFTPLPSGKRGFKYKLYKYKYLLFMLMPVILYFIVFNYIPLLGTVVAFKDFNYTEGIFKSPWVGFKNFEFFFKSGQAARITFNTFAYNITFMVVGTVLQLLIAILLAEITLDKFKKIAQSFMFLPYFISYIVVAQLVYNYLNFDYGIINRVIQSCGGKPINFYTTPGVWKYILVFVNTWKGLGYGTIVYLASIMGIDSEIYEAAEIDGANIFQRIRSITMPQLIPTVTVLTLMSLGNVFKGSFELFWQLVGTNGLLYETTDVINTFTYRMLMSMNEVGMSAAVGLYQSVLSFITVIVANAVVKKVSSDNALF